MKPMAYSRHKYSGELYKFVRETVNNESVLNHYYAGTIALTAGLDKFGKLIITTDENIQIGSIVANIKDAEGNLILDDTAWNVISTQPTMNAFNSIQYYRLITTKYAGEL